MTEITVDSQMSKRSESYQDHSFPCIGYVL